jgi:hypothetical protein
MPSKVIHVPTLIRLREAGGQGDKEGEILEPSHKHLWFLAQNVDFSYGYPVMRMGYSKLNSSIIGSNKITGLHWFKKSGSTGELLCACGTHIYKWTGSAWSSIKSGMTTGLRTWFCTLKDACYIQNGTDTALKWNGTAMANWGAGATQCPVGHFPIVHKDRVWVVPDAGRSLIRCSNINATNVTQPDEFVTTDQYRMREGDNEDISGLVSDGRTLMGLKPGSIMFILGDGALEGASELGFQQSPVHQTDGCESHASIVAAGNDIAYYNRSKLIAMNQLHRDIFASHLRDPLDIQDTTNYVNKSQRNLVAGIYHNNRILMSYPKGSATANDMTIAYFTETGLVSLWDFGASCWAIDDEGQLYFGSPTTGTVFKMDQAYADAGSDIVMILQSKYMDFGAPQLRKNLDGIFLGAKATAGKLEIDESHSQISPSYTTMRTIADLSAARSKVRDGANFYGARFRSGIHPELLSLKFTYTGQAAFEAYWLNLYAAAGDKRLS